MNRSTPGLPVHHQLLESTQIHVHCVGDAIQPSHPLSSPSPPALNLSQHQGLFKWPKYWSFSFNVSPSNEHPGLISFLMDWLDFLAVQGTLKSLLQHHSSKASILQLSAFFTVQLSHPSVQFSSVAQLCPTVCEPMNRSTPGLPVHHQLPEFTQTHVRRGGSHPYMTTKNHSFD